jgi:hypothetical protein
MIAHAAARGSSSRPTQCDVQRSRFDGTNGNIDMAADFVRNPAYPIEVKLVPYDGALLKVYCSGAFAVTGSLAGSTTELSVTTRYVASYSYLGVIER